MGRKIVATFKREILPDPKYKSTLIAKMVNTLMKDGKKSVAQGILYGAFGKIQEKGKDPMEVFKLAMENTKPVVEVKSRRVGGSNYQVPVEVGQFEGESLGSRWIIHAARERTGKSMSEKLAGELFDASNGQGSSYRKREETHKMAEANKAFAHYRY